MMPSITMPAKQMTEDKVDDTSQRFSGWSKLAKVLKASDETKIRDCKEDIDTLLVFAGLFSAVLTAFVIESYQGLQPDPNATSNQLLGRIASRLDDIYLHNTPSSTTAPDTITPSPFAPSAAAVGVNSLWFFSLVCSLCTASFAMLIKQWLRGYLAEENASPQAYARSRHTRYKYLVRWKVLEISALLPWLLQASLGTFLLGLALFIMNICKLVGELVAVCVVAWLLLFVLTMVAPIFYPQCPYRTSFFKDTFEYLHRAHSSRAKHRTEILPRIAVEEDTMDVDVLVSADTVLADDELLGTTIRECFQQIRGSQVVDGIRRLISRRMRLPKLANLGQPTLLRMSKRGAIAIADILVDALQREVDWQSREMGAVRQWYPWMGEAFSHVLHTPGYAASGLGPMLDMVFAQNDSVTEAMMAVFPLCQADETFLADTLRISLARLSGNEVVNYVRRAVLPKNLREKLCTLASFDGRAIWQELDWKTRLAFTRILVDTLNEEVRQQMETIGDIAHWHPWMTEALVSITALSNAVSTFYEVLSRLMVQNPVTTSQVLAALALNREGSGYGVYCGIGACLTTEKIISAIINNMHQWLQGKPYIEAYDSIQREAEITLSPMLMCELFTYIGCRCRTTFTSREGLQSSLHSLLSQLSRSLIQELAQGKVSDTAPQTAANCLQLIREFGLSAEDPRIIAPVDFMKTLQKVI